MASGPSATASEVSESATLVSLSSPVDLLQSELVSTARRLSAHMPIARLPSFSAAMKMAITTVADTDNDERPQSPEPAAIASPTPVAAATTPLRISTGTPTATPVSAATSPPHFNDDSNTVMRKTLPNGWQVR